ncbi:MAG TPA: cupin domain-containing protein [Candidatus Brevibacterium intestinigallinarum]|nr:cupin domain-containing protein [Candidatus Brevibacterium intestinigallinarum]
MAQHDPSQTTPVTTPAHSPTVNATPSHPITTSVTAESARLLETARSSGSHRAADTLYGDKDTLLRQTLIALLAGAELAEHSSPPEASLHVLSGSLRLVGDGRHWDLSAGDLVGIPPERHSVEALEDSVVLLTVLRDLPRSHDTASAPR